MTKKLFQGLDHYAILACLGPVGKATSARGKPDMFEGTACSRQINVQEHKRSKTGQGQLSCEGIGAPRACLGTGPAPEVCPPSGFLTYGYEPYHSATNVTVRQTMHIRFSHGPTEE